jgi:hypothetical protein
MRLRRATLVATVLAASGCGDGGSDADPVFGTYVLRNVNGLELPYTRLAAGSDTIVVLGGTLKLEADGSFTRTATERSRSSQGTATATFSCGGTYTHGGSDLVLVEAGGEGCGGSRSASLLGSNLIVRVGSSDYGYRK